VEIVVLGGRGFIGRAVVRALRSAGHDARTPIVDFARLRSPAAWREVLGAADAVVNAAGIFREGSGRTFDLVHDEAPRALFAACEAAGVRRVVQVSALGADAGAHSRFHRSKKRADDDLASRALDWAIVQPSLVFGPDGASARLFCLLASLPVVPLPGDGAQRVQPIHVDDLAALVLRLLEREPARARIAAVGPRALTIREWLATLRAQIGLPPARMVPVPRGLVRLAIGREALGMLERGNTAEPTTAPARPPEAFVAPGEGALLRQRARLDATLPILRVTVALMWLWSGVVSLGLYPAEESLAMLARVGLHGFLATAALYGAAALDVAIGLVLFLKTGRWIWWAQLVLICAYTAILTAFLPELWLHPFGPVFKNVPLAAAILLLWALEERR
jgi:uncharacterized protein YbjT (DUF2867 family)